MDLCYTICMTFLSRYGLSLALAALLLIFIGFGFSFLRISPTFQAPDERMHYAYIQTIAETGALPVLTEEKTTQEAYHPPLYYLIMQAPYAISRDLPDRAHILVLRAFGLLLSALVPFFVFRTAKALFPGRPTLAIGATALTALNPQLLYMSGTINNDVLANILGAIGLFLLARTIVRPFERRMVLLAVLAASALILTKTTVWPIALALLLVAVMATWRNARSLIWLFAVPFAAALWWLIRNLLVYGDPTSFAYQKTLWYETFHRDFFHPRGVWDWGKTVFESFWARFDYFTIALETIWYRLIEVMAAIGFAGFLFWFFAKCKRGSPTSRTITWFLVVGLVTFVMVFVYSLTFYQAQGRFFLPLVTVTSVLLMTGFEQLLPRRVQPVGSMALILFLLLLDWQSLMTLRRAYL